MAARSIVCDTPTSQLIVNNHHSATQFTTSSSPQAMLQRRRQVPPPPHPRPTIPGGNGFIDPHGAEGNGSTDPNGAWCWLPRGTVPPTPTDHVIGQQSPDQVANSGTLGFVFELAESPARSGPLFCEQILRRLGGSPRIRNNQRV